MHLKNIIKYACIFSFLCLLVGCSKPSTPKTYILNGPEQVTVEETFSFILTDNEGTAVTSLATWSTSDSELCVSLAHGSFKAIKAGTVTIIASYDNQLITQDITIDAAPIQKETLAITGITNPVMGEDYEYTIQGYAASIFTWSSSNNDILKSNGNGTFSALKAGFATISADSDLYTASLEVSVGSDIEVSIEPIPLKVYTGHTIECSVTSNLPETPVFVSNDRSIATISLEGSLKGIQEGEGTITVYLGSYSETFDVVVNDYKFYIYVDDYKYRVTEGETIDTVLTRIYGTNGHSEQTGKNFIGWFTNEALTIKCDTSSVVSEGLKIYSKYADISISNYKITPDKILIENSKFSSISNVTVFTDDYAYTLNNDLSNYNVYKAEFDIAANNYVIKETITNSDSKKDIVVPGNGFAIAIKKDYTNATLFDTYLSVGNKVGTDSYSIFKATYLVVNPLAETPSNAVTLSSNAISCNYAALLDANTNTILYSKNGTSQAYPASMTKMMTCITAMKYLNPEDTYVIGDEYDLCYEGSSPSVAGCVKGQSWTFRDLLYGTLLPSGNDAAYAIAAMVVEKLNLPAAWNMRHKIDYFEDLVNETAQEMGLVHSHFAVPDGNSYYTSSGAKDTRLTENYTCAEDMARIGAYLLKHPLLAHVVDTPSRVVYPNGNAKTLSLTNSAVKSNSTLYVGCKTGTTNWAGPCVTVGRWKNGKLIIAVVMYASTSAGRYTDAYALYTGYDQVNS